MTNGAASAGVSGSAMTIASASAATRKHAGRGTGVLPVSVTVALIFCFIIMLSEMNGNESISGVIYYIDLAQKRVERFIDY
jgi:hypothetical protein